jgi:hypothetical protein
MSTYAMTKPGYRFGLLIIIGYGYTFLLTLRLKSS